MFYIHVLNFCQMTSVEMRQRYPRPTRVLTVGVVCYRVYGLLRTVWRLLWTSHLSQLFRRAGRVDWMVSMVYNRIFSVCFIRRRWTQALVEYWIKNLHFCSYVYFILLQYLCQNLSKMLEKFLFVENSNTL